MRNALVRETDSDLSLCYSKGDNSSRETVSFLRLGYVHEG